MKEINRFFLYYCVALAIFLTTATLSAEICPGAIASFSSETKILFDSKTGLEWKVGPDMDICFLSAQTWINSLGNGWQTPTRDQLRYLYLFLRESGKSLPFKDPRPWVWATATDSDFAWNVYFGSGFISWSKSRSFKFFRAMAVRKRKQ
ncbi:MAG: DUF1566 domain-containing protein [Candidatus Riflebacteria bacterium]|nr:DUF1566 domain-containing protein [Candidatus Riflebacteria bacterium]